MRPLGLLILAGGLFLAGCGGNTQTLSVSVEGQGTVTSSPAGITCGSDCVEAYNSGTRVTLFASAPREYFFRGWSGDTNCGTNPVCVVDMNQARSLRATFVRNPDLCQGYSAPDITSRPNNFTGRQELRWGISEGCAQGRAWGSWTNIMNRPTRPVNRQWYFVGSFCAIRNTAQEFVRRTVISHPSFVGISGSGESYSQAAPAACTFSPRDLEKLASGEYLFQTGKVILRAQSNGIGGFSVQTVDRSPVREESWRLNRLVRIEIPASSGGITTSLNKQIECENGSCAIYVSAGEEIQLQANPAEGYVVDGWEGPGTENCSGASCVIRPLESASVRALFRKDRFQIVVQNGEGGTISSRPGGILCGEVCEAEFEAGETVELIAENQSGWMFDGWRGDCTGFEACVLQMNSSKQVQAVWKQFETPTITGPEVVPGPEEPFWSVRTTGGGQIECSIEELEIYAGGQEDESYDPTETTRRFKGPCTENDTVENFLTPTNWPGLVDEDDEDVQEQTPEGSPAFASGETLYLPDGHYQVLISQQLFYDSDPSDDQEPSLVGSGETAKDFYLDRKAPEPVRFRDDPDVDEQQVEGDWSWSFSWGRDLTQRGKLFNQWRWNGQSWEEVSNPGEAAIRCSIKPVVGNQVQDTELLSTDWGGCGMSEFDSDGESTRWATTPQGEWPSGTFSPGQNNVGSLEEGRYRLFVEQRDRAGYQTETVLPFQKVQTFSLQSPSQDSVRFGARWQNVFVADTRQPSGAEGTIGEAWHPLRCRASGVGILDDCVDIDLTDTTAEEKADELAALQGDEELWEKSFLVPEGEPGSSYKAQGYLRMATPGRFESNRGDRRTMHVRLLIDPVSKAGPDEDWEGTYKFCNYPLATTNSANIIAQAAAATQSDCQGTFPVQGNPRVYLRSDTEGIIAEGDSIETREPIEITPRSEYRPQNAVTGNSEIHICQPGVPSSLEGEIPGPKRGVSGTDIPERTEVTDVYDGRDGPLVEDENRNQILGPAPDPGCEGYAMVWRWSPAILEKIVVNTSQGLLYNGDPSICEALPRESTFPRPPSLEEMAAGYPAGSPGDPVAQAVLGRVGSYRSGSDLPYQSASGEVLWQSQGQGDPFVLASAPWDSIGRVRCSNGNYLGASSGGQPNGEWDLWLPTRQEPNLISDPNATSPPSTVDPKGAVPPVTGPGFGTGLYSLPLASNLDGLPGTLDEGLLVDWELAPASEAASGRNGYYWFMDARYYGYHLQRWAYSTDLDSERQDIEILAPRSSR